MNTNEWITDRLPTREDADSKGRVWTSYKGVVMCWSFDGVAVGTPWMPIVEQLEGKYAQLEASHAELLEAAKEAMQMWDEPAWRVYFNAGPKMTRLRAAIAKAEGGQV